MIVYPMTRPDYIDEKTWNGMSWKEQDLVILLREKRYTKDQIKRALYIITDSWYWKLKKKVSYKIKKWYEDLHSS